MSAPAKPAFRFLLISDFNLSNLAALLHRQSGPPALSAVCAPYGQVMQIFLRPDDPVWLDHNAALVWTLPQRVSAALGRRLEGLESANDQLAADVDAFCRALESAPASIEHIFLPLWTLPPHQGRLGLLDLDADRGVSAALLEMNSRLATHLQKHPRIHLLDTGRWIAALGEKSFSSKLWYMSKTPFSVELFKEAATELQGAAAALAGQNKKLIVLDLDDTLWGGIVGDVGWENLRLGGHDPVGEAYRDFQLALKALKNRGVLLALVSKNTEAVALEAIRSHPEMVLRADDFVGWRINWSDKARNISELAVELNLGLQSVVFIDDNPVERDRVRGLGEVFVPDWPANPMEYPAALQRLRCFDVAAVTAEDRQRSDMYVSDRRRKETLGAVGSVAEWLASLEIRVVAEPLDQRNLERAAQLLNKTNQMNLSTRRMTQGEFWNWSREPDHEVIVFRVADKFGDYGLVGLGGLSRDGTACSIVDFVLSCRVMGRKVEETMLHLLSRRVLDHGTRKLSAVYLPTKKNEPCLQFFAGCGLRRQGDTFICDLSQPYPMPEMISLEERLAAIEQPVHV